MSAVAVIAIDGPGGSGKGTIALHLARKLGWNLLDSGALYRLVAVAALDRGVDPDDEDGLARVAGELDARFEAGRDGVEVVLDGVSVTDRLRAHETSEMASRVASVPAVRSALVARQRGFRQPPGLIADGRDMGTVIFPDAELKIFLTASAEARAQRRYKQLKEKGESVNLSRLSGDIAKRDERDRTRAVAPLKPADDAHVIDSTEMSIEEVLSAIQVLIEETSISL